MAGCQLRGGFRCPPLPRSTISAPFQQLSLTMRQGQSRLDARALRATWTIQGLRTVGARSEEHTSELQSRLDLVCRLLLEKKKQKKERYRSIKKKKKKNKKKNKKKKK